jgi:hypothetical protein
MKNQTSMDSLLFSSSPNDNAPVLVNQAAMQKRLPALDYMKGLACIMLFYWHYGMIYSTAEWGLFFNLTQVFLDFFGPALFVTLSIVSVMISHESHATQVGKKPYRKDSLLKTSYLLIVGEVSNAVNCSTMGGYCLLGINVIMFIALYHLLIPQVLKLGYKARLVLVIFLGLLFEPVFFWAYQGLVDGGISVRSITGPDAADPRVVIWFFLCDVRMAPLISWSILAIMTTMVFEKFSVVYNRGTRSQIRTEMRRILIYGLICMAIAVVLSLPLSRSLKYQDLVHDAYPYLELFFPRNTPVPQFLIRHTPQYMLYCFGIICVVFYTICHRQLVKGLPFHWEEKLQNFGKMSLTAYIYSFTSFLVPLKMDLPIFFAFMAGFIPVLVTSFWYWNWYLKKFGSFEWIKDQYVKAMFFAARRIKLARIERSKITIM